MLTPDTGAPGRPRFADVALFPVRILVVALVLGRAEPVSPRDPRTRWWVRASVSGNLMAAVVLFLPSAGYTLETAGLTRGGLFLSLFWSLVLSATVVTRTRWPLGSWRVALAGLGWTGLTVGEAAPLPIVVHSAVVALLCCYTVGTRTPWTTALGAWLLTVGGFTAQVLLISDALLDVVPLAALGTAVATLAGINRRTRRIADHEQAAGAARNAKERTARALAEERSRIARELHDVVAHHMSAIAIQAEAAPLRHPDDSAALTSELRAIRGTALQALSETRHILSVLREDGQAGDTGPQPGLDRIEELVARVRAAGHPVELHTSGTPRTASRGAELSAYRIVQESLSNAMRHAPGSAVELELGYEPGTLRIRVGNGPARRPGRVPEGREGAGGGHGLLGMRERAAMLFGTLTAGPTGSGGFEVVALLPWETA
ncbi:sensor histidine kinase [Amycolatopsis sp.]|uniref:sensor histidine kinase n=1 Tax=Amycolatopsis sp. TaxID=37632 RepID=UPI002D7E683F|nr:histidine kinase [Amycolatopsis sp.]HET6708330.1 histidine kinase [Amycolatopsis sp.]